MTVKYCGGTIDLGNKEALPELQKLEPKIANMDSNSDKQLTCDEFIDRHAGDMRYEQKFRKLCSIERQYDPVKHERVEEAKKNPTIRALNPNQIIQVARRIGKSIGNFARKFKDVFTGSSRKFGGDYKLSFSSFRSTIKSLGAITFEFYRVMLGKRKPRDFIAWLQHQRLQFISAREDKCRSLKKELLRVFNTKRARVPEGKADTFRRFLSECVPEAKDRKTLIKTILQRPNPFVRQLAVLSLDTLPMGFDKLKLMTEAIGDVPIVSETACQSYYASTHYVLNYLCEKRKAETSMQSFAN